MDIQTLSFAADRLAPNHPRWPVILYPAVIRAGADAGRAFEERFTAHGWQGGWRGEVYDYVHYHAHAHEVLGVARGRATLRLGGEHGTLVQVAMGDCVLLPAGTGHQCVQASADFDVIAAYPPGQAPDLQTHPASPELLEAIAALPVPATDPLEGARGAVHEQWRA